MSDFRNIHRMSRAGMWRDVIANVYDHETSGIKAKYADDSNHAWYVIGNSYYRLREFDLAAQAFQNAYEARSDDAEALKQRVRARVNPDAAGRVTLSARANAVKGRVPA